MSKAYGPFTLGSTGTYNLNIGFAPTSFRVVIGGLIGTDTQVHLSMGRWTPTHQSCNSIIIDGPGHQSINKNYCISHYNEYYGVNEILKATCTGVTAGVGPNFNVTIANPNLQIFIEADDL